MPGLRRLYSAWGVRCAGRALLALAALAACAVATPPRATAAAPPRALLLLPIASGTPGAEWSAKAVGGILEDLVGSLAGARLVAGSPREGALRELTARESIPPEEFFEVCRRAGADVAVLGGSTLVEGRLSLELRVFNVAAAKEEQTFRGEEPVARVFALAAAAVRQLAAEAGVSLGEADEARLSRMPTASLEAYAAYREALAEKEAAARIEKLRGALALDDRYADAAQRLGVELFRQGASQEALDLLERAVALDPNAAESRNNLGVVLASLGRAEQAQREFAEAVRLDPGYAEARLNLARLLEERGSLEEAESHYTAILEADPANDKARFGLAVIYDRTSRPELALKEFRLLSARRPDLAEGEFIRAGQEARKSREYARAEKYFQRAADINPQQAEVWAELGTNSYLAGEYSRGVEFFRKALAIEPARAEFHYFLGLALDRGRLPEQAVGEFRRSVELGGPPEARLGLARAALAAGDPGLAVEELNRLLAASPDHAEAKTLLAQATAEMEARRRLVEGQSRFANQRLARLEEIVADANRARRGLEAQVEGLNRDRLLLEEQVRQEQERAARRGEEFDRRLADEVARTAVARADAAACERSLQEARAQVRDLALELGRAALRAGSWETAKAYFEQVVSLDPSVAEAWNGLGEAHLRLGNPDRSREMYDRARATH